MATQGDRSVGAGITIPNWMKSKMNDKFDFDQSAFSPTELDDSFMFHYRQPPSTAIKDMKESKMITSALPENITVTTVSKKNQDFSKHPPPCQKYLQNIVDVGPPPQTTPQMKLKPSGTDDGFKGEAAKCGSSIIRVANQMVAGKVIHGFTIDGNTICEEGEQPKYDLMKRRGSKSLPASPLASPNSSPKTQRKAINKYFTGAFTDIDKSKGGWILSNLLARREISQSMGYIGEETKEELERSSSTISIDDVNHGRKSPLIKAKPSELREMNFWSPTSM